jgi:hypothetical protein
MARYLRLTVVALAALAAGPALAQKPLADQPMKTDAHGQVQTNTTRGFRAQAKPLSADQQAFVASQVKTAAKPPAQNVKAPISIGSHVGENVKFYELPAAVLERVPAYQPYQYFTTARGEVVIVDPDTRLIVQTVSPPAAAPQK